MTKIILNSEQYATIDTCCQKLGISHNHHTDTTFFESINAVLDLCENLTDKLNKLQDTLVDVTDDVAERNIQGIVGGLKEICDLTADISDDTSALCESTKDTVASFREASEKLSFVLLRGDSFIRKLIRDNFNENTTMAVAFNGTEYALMFCELIDDVEQPPYSINIFAKGDEDAYDDVEAYIQKFLNL